MISNKTLLLFGAVVSTLLSLANSSYHEEEHYDSHPHYKFEYSVHDPHTHDIKSQAESRDGDYVRGYYKLKEADGSVREVHYTADKHSGFSAKVTKDGLPLYQEPSSHHYSYSTASESGHYGGHYPTSTQHHNSKHYHQHEVILHHHH